MSVRFSWLGAVAACLFLAGCSLSASPGATGKSSGGFRTPSGALAGSGAAAVDPTAASQAVAGSEAAAGTSAAVAPAGAGNAGAAGIAAGMVMGPGDAAGAGAAAQSGVAGTASRPAADSGTGASASAGASAPGSAFIREQDPTESSIKAKGEYTVKSYTELAGLVGGAAYGDGAVGGDGSELYYPEDATPPFAAMAIIPGFVAQRSDIAPWAVFLASHGIVSLAIDTNDPGDPPDVRAQALLDALESLKKENLRVGSPLQGKLDTTHLGVMGWSMGGGGTWIAGDGHPELKVAVSLCGWIIGAPGSTTTVPSLQLAALDDGLAKGMSQPVYAAIPSGTPKMLVEWASGGHWTNNDPANQSQQVGRYGLAWIKIFLEGDERYRQFLNVMPTASSDFQHNQR